MANARGHSMLIGGSFSYDPIPPTYTGRVRYTYADGTQLETTGTGTTLTVSETQQIPESELAGCSMIEVGDEIVVIDDYAFLASGRPQGIGVELRNFKGYLILSNNITTFREYAINGFTLHRPLLLPTSLTHIYNYGLHIQGYNYPLELPSSLTFIGMDGIAYLGYFNHPFTVPSSVTAMRSGCLSEWVNFNSTFIDNSLTYSESGVLTNWNSFNQPFTINSNHTFIGQQYFGGWWSYNQEFHIPDKIANIYQSAFVDWRSYTQDFVFDHVDDNIPTFNTYIDPSHAPIWNLWKNHHPAKITTPNSTRVNSEWKSAIGDANYNGGDIESINGVLWNDITDNFKIRMVYSDGTTAFEVPLDGSTIVTQADGDSAINHYTIDKIKRMIIGNTMTEIADSAFSGYAGNNSRWTHFNGEVVLPNSLIHIRRDAFTYWSDFNKAMVFPSSIVDFGEYINTLWESYTNESRFNHINPPTFTGQIFREWHTYHPARIMTGDQSNTDLSYLTLWKDALKNNIDPNDISHINNVLWADIP